MRNHNLAVEGTRVQLVNQLVFFDEEVEQFYNQYFPNQDVNRKNITKLIAKYKDSVEELLSNFSGEHLKTIVLIGSRVQFRYLEDDEIETVTIVFPNFADPEENIVSFLSPLAMQLLLGKLNQVYELELPVGKVLVEITNISFENKGTILAS